jgi:hypothetical protein
MLTDNRADYRTQDWFLVACGGDLVLKLAQDLMIGEDERGQTVLSPAREEALLRITSEHGCLTLQAMAMDWTFSEEGGLSRQHLTFVEGLTLKLSFPKSSLILTQDFQAGARAIIDREIRLLPTQSPTLTLTRVDEPVTLIEPALLPAPEAANAESLELEADLHIEEAAEQAETADAPTCWDHQIPGEEAASQPAVAAVGLPATAPAKASANAEQSATDNHAPATTAVFEEPPVPEIPESQVPEDQAPDSQAPAVGELQAAQSLAATGRKSHRPLAGLIAASALLAPMCLFLVDGQKLGVDFPLTNYRPLEESVQNMGSIERSPAPIVEEVEEIEEIKLEAPVLPQPTAETGPNPLPEQAPAVDEQQQLLIASLLAEAKAFYDAGRIVTPIEANAVSHLTQVLSMDPFNEAGLRLMYLSAVTLIEEAEAAHAAGDNFLARNLVEDVLGFHPEFDEARALLDSWTRVPEG